VSSEFVVIVGIPGQEPCDGGPRRRIMYFATVDWATSNLSSSSPLWIRGEPHSGFAALSSDGTSRYPPDQAADLSRNFGPTAARTRPPSPIRSEPYLMPAHDCSSDVCFSNRPGGVKRFQTIRRCSVDVARGLVLLFGIGARALPSWDPRTRWNDL